MAPRKITLEFDPEFYEIFEEVLGQVGYNSMDEFIYDYIAKLVLGMYEECGLVHATAGVTH